jgi:hypothetical protein
VPSCKTTAAKNAARRWNQYAQLILVGALVPVTTFAYKGTPLVNVREGCELTTLATHDHAILAALDGLPKRSGRRPSRRRAGRERRALRLPAL